MRGNRGRLTRLPYMGLDPVDVVVHGSNCLNVLSLPSPGMLDDLNVPFQGVDKHRSVESLADDSKCLQAQMARL